MKKLLLVLAGLSFSVPVALSTASLIKVNHINNNTVETDNNTVETEKTNENQVVPRYQGMTVSSNTIKMNKVFLPESVIQNYINNDMQVSEFAKLDYYCNSGDKVTVSINIYNPSQYEILSFVLNGTKYQAYQFLDTSTSSRIDINIDMNFTSGIHEINLEGIKYIDGTEIKDVILEEGNTQLKVGVSYSELPNVDTNIKASYTSIGGEVSLKDSENAIGVSGGYAKAYILDENGIVDSCVLPVGSSNIEFKGLDIVKDYTVVVAALYDSYDSKGTVARILYSEQFTTLNYINIVNEKVTYDSINFNVDKKVTNLSIKSVDLYLNNEVVKTINENRDEYSINNIYSNNTYLVKITYEVGNITYITTKEFTTLSKTEPTVEVKLGSTKESISYNISTIDLDKLLSLTKIELLLNGKVVKTIDDLSNDNGVIEELLSNTEYTVRVHYSYDLNEGNGKTDEYVDNTCTTLSKTEPTVEIKLSSTKESISYKISSIDPDKLLSLTRIELLLNDKVVKTIDDLSSDSGVIEKLLSNTEYTVRVHYSYDSNEGNGKTDKYVDNKCTTLSKTEPTVEVKLDSTKESISYKIFSIDPDKLLSLTKIELLLNDKVVKTIDDLSSDSGVIEKLLSNTEYTVRVHYSYDLNEGNGKTDKYLDNTCTTLSKTEPTVEVKLGSTKESISYNISTIDPDKLLSLTKIELLLNGKVVKTIDDLSNDNDVIEELLSNTEYTVRVHYSYDSNEGNGKTDKYVDNKCTTLSKTEPTVEVKLNSTKESISYSISSIDPDNLLSLTKIELLLNGKVVKTIDDLSNDNDVIEELLSNTEYTVRVHYSYDLNEGNDKTDTYKDFSYTTQAEPIEIDSINLLSNSAIKTSQEINLNVKLINPSKIRVSSVIVNDTLYDVIGGDYINNIIFKMYVGKKSGLMNISIDGFKYELRGHELVQNVTTSNTIECKIESRLGIVDVYTVDQSDLVNSNISSGVILEIDNPTGYIVDSVELSNSQYTWDTSSTTFDNFVMIDNDHIYINTNLYTGKNYFKVVSIKYHFDNNDIVRNYNDTFSLFVNKLNPDDNGAIKTNYISTPEDLLNIESNQSYELLNDIDMDGYSWTPCSFSGYFDGKGHTISNLTISLENEYKYTQNLSMFTSLSGTFKNVYIKNAYYSIETDGEVNISILSNNNSATIENVIFNGNVSIGSIGNSYNFKNDVTYIADDVMINISNSSDGTTENKVLASGTITSAQMENEIFIKETLGWEFVSKTFYEYNGFKYYIVDDSYIVIDSYNGSDTNVTIPEEIENMPVVVISDYAFKDNLNIESLVIPETVLTLGGGLLTGCTNLSSLTIPARLSISYIFGSTGHDSIKSIALTAETYNLDSDVNFSFNGWSNLENVVLPEGITNILDSAFYNCTNLQNVVIPNSVTSINAYAFYNCSSLQSVAIGNSVKSMYALAFAGCNNLTNIYYNGSLEDWINIKAEGFSSRPNCGSSNAKLYLLDEEGNVKVNDNTYSLLINAVIPDGVTSIGYYTFGNISDLVSVVIPDSVTSIGSSAFYNCTNLQNVVIGNSVTSIENIAFSNCNNLTNIYYNGSLENWINIKAEGFSSRPNCGSSNAKLYLLDEEGKFAFNNNNYSLLTDAVIPDGVTTIGEYSFANLSKLVSVELPESVTSIVAYAFYNCTSLQSIVIGKGVTNIPYAAFGDCSNLMNVYYLGTPEEWNNIKIEIANERLNYATTYYYSEEKPTDTTYKYWHYVNDVPTKWEN